MPAPDPSATEMLDEVLDGIGGVAILGIALWPLALPAIVLAAALLLALVVVAVVLTVPAAPLLGVLAFARRRGEIRAGAAPLRVTPATA